MTPERFKTITAHYPRLRIAVVGDFCLDRYLEIDPARREISLETNLPVYNVVNIRPQPGGAGTIVNNLAALGVGEIFPVGFCGEDGEGFELRRALTGTPGVRLDHFLTTAQRRTFTYCKPLVKEPNRPPIELNRLDSKNWTPTPATVIAALTQSLATLMTSVDAVIAMDQVDAAETGVITSSMLTTLAQLSSAHSNVPVIADSRRGLRWYPPLIYKMNAAELAALSGLPKGLSVAQVQEKAKQLARQNQRAVFVTMAEHGIVGSSPDGVVEYVKALPLRGPIDIVGAGDSVTANLAVALAAGASLCEAVEIAIIASSLVIHQLGTTGTASVQEIAALLPELKP